VLRLADIFKLALIADRSGRFGCSLRSIWSPLVPEKFVLTNQLSEISLYASFSVSLGFSYF